MNLVRGRCCDFEKVSDLGKASDLGNVNDLGKACDFGKVSNLRKAPDFEKVSDLEKTTYLSLSATVIRKSVQQVKSKMFAESRISQRSETNKQTT